MGLRRWTSDCGARGGKCRPVELRYSGPAEGGDPVDVPAPKEGQMSVGTDHDRRTGENEALFREVNERLQERKEDHSAWAIPSQWICECADEACTERIEMSLLEYEDLRSEPTHFAVVPNEKHVSFDVEQIVKKFQDYWVVEKVGVAAEVAEETDPR
jgi:hypothetical protein